MSSSSYFYAGADNKPIGPVTLEELRKLRQDGVIQESTNVIAEGGQEWIRYGDLAASQQGSEVAERIAKQARNVGAALGKFDWGAFLFGLLLVLVQVFILPYTLLKKAGTTLSSWGQSKILPTAQSDLPVLTFLTVLIRPAVHIVYTVWATIKTCVFLYNGKFDHLLSLSGVTASSYGFVEDWRTKLKIFCLLLVGTYFCNILIALAFDAVSVLVSMANSLKNIERK